MSCSQKSRFIYGIFNLILSLISLVIFIWVILLKINLNFDYTMFLSVLIFIFSIANYFSVRCFIKAGSYNQNALLKFSCNAGRSHMFHGIVWLIWLYIVTSCCVYFIWKIKYSEYIEGIIWIFYSICISIFVGKISIKYFIRAGEYIR